MRCEYDENDIPVKKDSLGCL